MNVAKFPSGLFNVLDKFQPNLVMIKLLVWLRIHKQEISKMLKFSSECVK